MENPEMKFSPEHQGQGDTNRKGSYVVRIRGLPWSASKEEIMNFFQECDVKDGAQGIHLTMSKEGRPSGEAYIEFNTEEDYNKALAKDNEHLGSRYIEVFQATQDEMDWALKRCGLDCEEAFGDACVRLRGLPFGCSKEEIAQFFTGLEIVRNGITLRIDFQGRSTGEAYVQFASQDIAENAMGKHKEKIGHRYIEIFKSSLQEVRSAMGPMRMRNMGTNRLSPYDRMDRPSGFGSSGGSGFGMGRGGRGGKSGRSMSGSGYGGDRFGYYGGRGGGQEEFTTGHRVHMRGLPYRAVESDIYDFFAPLSPACVTLKYEPSGRSSGEADVEFNTHDEALKAMKLDKEKIQHRYIELFLHSSADSFRRDNFDGMGGGGYPSGDERSYGMGRSFSGRGRAFSGDGERSFGDRGYGPGGGDRGFGLGAGDRGFYSGFGYSGTGAGAVTGGRSGFGMGSGEYRNGNMNNSSNMGTGGNNGGYMNEGYGGGYGGQETGKDDSEFYGSGKLFGENNYQQAPMSQGMMGGSNYTSF